MRTAITYTLLANCRRLGVNPQAYLLDVLTRLPSLTNRQTADLTPRRWLAARSRSQAACVRLAASHRKSPSSPYHAEDHSPMGCLGCRLRNYGAEGPAARPAGFLPRLSAGVAGAEPGATRRLSSRVISRSEITARGSCRAARSRGVCRRRLVPDRAKPGTRQAWNRAPSRSAPDCCWCYFPAPVLV